MSRPLPRSRKPSSRRRRLAPRLEWSRRSGNPRAGGRRQEPETARGYVTIAMVDNVVAAATVKSVLRSSLSFGGIRAARASAAYAPQIATEALVSNAKRHFRPNIPAVANPIAIVTATSEQTRAMVPSPRKARFSTVMRRPRSATPTRNTVVEAKAMPATHRSSYARKLKLTPISSANSITGAP